MFFDFSKKRYFSVKIRYFLTSYHSETLDIDASIFHYITNFLVFENSSFCAFKTFGSKKSRDRTNRGRQLPDTLFNKEHTYTYSIFIKLGYNIHIHLLYLSTFLHFKNTFKNYPLNPFK